MTLAYNIGRGVKHKTYTSLESPIRWLIDSGTMEHRPNDFFLHDSRFTKAISHVVYHSIDPYRPEKAGVRAFVLLATNPD